MATDYETGIDATSKFNSGMLINIRLNNLWILTHNTARKGLYSEWSAILDRIWCELSADVLDDKKGKETDKNFADIEKELSKFGVTNWGRINEGFEEKDAKAKLLMTQQYRQLMVKEIFLRRLQNQQGKGTAYYDESENDWEQKLTKIKVNSDEEFFKVFENSKQGDEITFKNIIVTIRRKKCFEKMKEDQEVTIF